MAKKCIICYLAAAMFIIGIAPRVDGAFSPSQAVGTALLDRASDLARVQTVLENKLVEQRLQDLGFTVEEIRARLSQLTDSQIHGIAQKLDDLKVGGDSALGVVIAILVIVILVIILINLTTGHKVIVTQ